MEELLEKLERDRRTRKGENGKVAIIAGSQEFAGAPALAAKAALRSGADLVRVMTSEEVASTVASYSEDLIIESYSGGFFSEEDVDAAVELVEWSDATLIGPGLSKPEDCALQQVFEQVSADLVIDADAIAAAVRANLKAVYTPHRGETLSMKDELGSVERFADETGSTVVVTGPSDSVVGAENFRCERGTPAMTVGGTGDVLAGLITGIRSQGLTGFEAAKVGVWLNGRAGELAAEEKGVGLVASDVVEKIPEALQD